jgi:hypothetical protein
MELNLPAFVAHRVKKLQTPRKLIEEIDSEPEPQSSLPPGKLKPVTFKGISAVEAVSCVSKYIQVEQTCLCCRKLCITWILKDNEILFVLSDWKSITHCHRERYSSFTSCEDRNRYILICC